jgi:hypothetical protein
MIKFFRKKRYDLMEKKNTGKYFKYAFGEIVLVVIGILIALSINNWNTNRLNNQVEKVILNNLKKDLMLELDNLDSHKTMQNIWINSGTEILKNYDSNDGFLVDDELLASINDLMIRSAFLPTKSTYQTIENTGKIDLINNRNLKEEILIYYKDISWFSKNTTDNNTYLVDQLVNNKLIELTFFQTKSFSKELREEWTVFDIENYKLQKSNRFIEQVQKELNNLENSLNLINVVSFRMFLANIQIDFAQKSESDTRNLITSLEIELNK